MATIYCFTSTGNSLYTAKRLAEQIGGSVQPMNGNHCEDDIIGFVFPVYYWGLPRLMERFVSQLQIADKNPYIFAVVISGGALAFGVLGRLKQLLKEKGLPLNYGKKLVSVSNYTPEYEPKDSETFQQKRENTVLAIADGIKRRNTNQVLPYTFVNKIIYKMFPDETSDSLFTVSPACISCETCQKVCPVGNIRMTDGKPEFRHHCEHCLGCLQNCPVQAIDWNETTQDKQRYRNSNVSVNDLIEFHGKQKA